MNSISITLNNQEISDLLSKFKFVKNLDNEKIKYTLKLDNNHLTIYSTNVLLIQGKDVEKTYYKLFRRHYKQVDPISSKFFNEDSYLNANFELEQYHTISVGTDEVGNGDFFLGICVCGAIVKPEQIPWLKSLNVKDSKKISDKKIMVIGQQLIEKIEYYCINLDAEQYNKLYKKINNLNALKTYLHNKCFNELTKKIKEHYISIIDQFVSEKKYYEYLVELNSKVKKIDCFSIRAEDKYFCVAVGAIIARYFHLINKKELETKLQISIPLGSSNENIKSIALEIINKFSLNQFKKMVKNNFKTYDEILSLLK